VFKNSLFWGEMMSHCGVLNCISLVISDVEQFFTHSYCPYILTTLIASLVAPTHQKEQVQNEWLPKKKKKVKTGHMCV
jgi:hypothetical protein